MADLVEEWRAVTGYEGRYEVSSLGRVRSWVTTVGSRVVALSVPEVRTSKAGGSKGQYLVITLSLNGEKRRFYIHRLVAIAFIGPPPPGHEVAHDDGNGHHNAWTNLIWKTRKANHADKQRHGTQPRGEGHWNSKLTAEKVSEMRRLGGSPTQRAREAGVSETAARQAMEGKTWAHV
jgi:hypothetical protein